MIAISHSLLSRAAADLASIDRETLRHLHVRSGEHLAALLLTAFLGHVPVEVDLDGGVDLRFDLQQPTPSGLDLGSSAAFEVKSLPGAGFRKYEAQLPEPDDHAAHYVTVQSAADVLEDAAPQLRSAADALTRKRPAASRNAFLVIHPFDHLAVEIIDQPLLAHRLPPLAIAAELQLSTVWVLWVPDHLTMWSTTRDRWTEMLFRVFDPDHPEAGAGPLSVLQEAEAEFLDASGLKGSPYLFGLSG